MSLGILDAGVVAAFLAGIVAFLSPCVLPLMPGYLSVVTRLSYEDLADARRVPRFSKVIVPSVVFVLGFSTVFISLGAFSSHVGSLFSSNKTLLLRTAGVFVALFGIFTMELVRIPFLARERRISSLREKGGLLGTYLLGVAFGFGWTPCVGPILGSILLYAATAEGTLGGAGLLLVYSLGLGVPFLLVGVAFDGALKTFGTVRKYYPFYRYAVGGGLIAVGALMFSGDVYYLNIYGQKILDAVGIDFWKRF